MQAYCLKCRAMRNMRNPSYVTMKDGELAMRAPCPVCDTQMYRMAEVKQKAAVKGAVSDDTWRCMAEVEQRAAAVQRAAWDDKWRKKLEIEGKQATRALKAEAAAHLTQLGSETAARVGNTLRDGLEVQPFDWDTLKDYSEFSMEPPSTPQHASSPAEPDPNDAKYRPRFGIVDHLFASRRQRRLGEAADLFKRDHDWWEKKTKEVEKENSKADAEYERDLAGWKAAKESFYAAREQCNRKVDDQRQGYLNRVTSGVVEYFGRVLVGARCPVPVDRKIKFEHRKGAEHMSVELGLEVDLLDPDYGGTYQPQVDFEYREETGLLVVDYRLPCIDDIPNLKELRYLPSKDTAVQAIKLSGVDPGGELRVSSQGSEFQEIRLSAAARGELYDAYIYQLSLRLIHALYAADVATALQSVVLNGWVEYKDPGTGNDVRACILSVQAGREEFLAIDLRHVDAKACFKALKGVGSSRLHGLAPVAPILRISREDKRFVESRDVADTLDDTFNLAAMEWEDFEHLVREVFEKEFGQEGGEVKITRASRDRGVDAIAFDLDPIRGGKIVIQAKCYTNTVGVDAVRDLYGTVINEGAMKGILVTTSDYGPDAYEFARDKPLTLLSGSNLLHLLGKYGHKAKIDLAEAKRIRAERDTET